MQDKKRRELCCSTNCLAKDFSGHAALAVMKRGNPGNLLPVKRHMQESVEYTKGAFEMAQGGFQPPISTLYPDISKPDPTPYRQKPFW